MQLCCTKLHCNVVIWRHFQVHHVDEQWTTCDFCIACQFKEEPDGLKVDYVGTIEEILEVDFRSFKTLVLKVQWFCNTAQWKIACFAQSTPPKNLRMVAWVISLLYFWMRLNKSFLQKIDLTPKEVLFCKIIQNDIQSSTSFWKLLGHGLMVAKWSTFLPVI
jgi:hypothetical protein